MKSGIHSIPFSMFFIFVLLTGVAAAGAVEVWNSSSLSNVSESSYLRIHGTILVWQARGGLSGTSSGRNDLEIFCCDLDTLNVRQITDDNYDDSHPETDGRYVVWQKYVRGKGTSIYLFDAKYGSPQGGMRISSSDGDSFMPFVSNGHVVWTSQHVDTVYRPGTIKLFSPETDSVPRTISQAGADASNPFIYKNRIVWTQTVTEGQSLNSEKWQYDMNWYAPTAVPLPAWITVRRSNSSDGQYSVFSINDGNDGEIFLQEDDGRKQQITYNEIADHSPVMSRNHAAWLAGSTIVAADISDMIAVNGVNAISASSRAFTLRWKRLFEQGVEGYYIDVSTHPDFTIPVPGYLDRPVGNRSYCRIRGLKPDTTYYYRVRAVVNGSTTADSASGSITTDKKPTVESWWITRLRYFRTLFSGMSRIFH